jgi:hypothetical protein
MSASGFLAFLNPGIETEKVMTNPSDEARDKGLPAKRKQNVKE